MTGWPFGSAWLYTYLSGVCPFDQHDGSVVDCRNSLVGVHSINFYIEKLGFIHGRKLCTLWQIKFDFWPGSFGGVFYSRTSRKSVAHCWCWLPADAPVSMSLSSFHCGKQTACKLEHVKRVSVLFSRPRISGASSFWSGDAKKTSAVIKFNRRKHPRNGVRKECRCRKLSAKRWFWRRRH